MWHVNFNSGNAWKIEISQRNRDSGDFPFRIQAPEKIWRLSLVPKDASEVLNVDFPLLHVSTYQCLSTWNIKFEARNTIFSRNEINEAYLPGNPTKTSIVGTWLEEDALDFPECDAPLLLWPLLAMVTGAKWTDFFVGPPVPSSQELSQIGSLSGDMDFV